MLVGPDGRVASIHYVPPSLPPPTAQDVSTAKAGLQTQLGNAAPDSPSLAAAIRTTREQDAATSSDALARAAILLQVQYDETHHETKDSDIDPVREAESEVGLTHQFDQDTLDAATRSLSDSALATVPAAPSGKAPTVSLVDARGAIQAGRNNGLTWQEAVNAARVQFGGSAQNEMVLDEAALTVDGDGLATGADASHGDVLGDAAQQLAGLHLFDDGSNRDALAALRVTLAPSPALAVDAKRADAMWASWQQDVAAHADATQIAADLKAYHTALSTELDDAADLPQGSAAGTASWATDASQSDRRWLAERAVIAANTTAGTRGPSANDLFTALKASEILDATQAAPLSVGPGSNGAANLKAAQVLTQQLAGVSPTKPLYQQVMDDPRTAVLENGAFSDIIGAQGGDAKATLTAEGTALSGYRSTALFPALLHDVSASGTTQHNLQAVNAPDNLKDIPNLLDPLAHASPELAQALFTQWQGKIEDLIRKGPDVGEGNGTSQDGDAYYAPLERIVDDVGGPRSAAARPVMDALRTQLQQQQGQVDEGGTEALSNPFQPLASLHGSQQGHSVAVYQALIDEAPTSELAKTLEQYTGLKPQSAPATVQVSPADASALAQAQTALATQMGGAPVNAQTLQQALAAARAATGDQGQLANANISDTTWAQAAIVEQAQADSRANAGSNVTSPDDLIAQVSGELQGDQLFDTNTLDAATQALQSGSLTDGSAPPTSKQIQQVADGGSATDYMQGLVNAGMTMPEAIVLTRAWLGGTSGSEPALVQAALTVRAGQQDIMQQYFDNSSLDPVTLAAQQLKAMKVTLGDSGPVPVKALDPALIDQVVGGTPASGGKPAVPGLAQDIKPDLTALNGANGKPGLIAQVQSAHDAWQGAQTRAAANPHDGNAQNAAHDALTQYHAVLSTALNAAAGRAPNDSSWQSNPVYTDTLRKAQTQLELAALAPQIQAVADGQDPSAPQALDSAFEQWQSGFDALQIIGSVQHARQSATPPGADSSEGDVAAAQKLTDETNGLQRADPELYGQVMGDAFVGNLARSALASITAARPAMCLSGDGIAGLTAQFHAEGSLLQQYQPTVLYAQLMDGVAADPATQQFFSTIGSAVGSHKNDADKLQALAGLLQGSGSTDLSALLVHQMFSTDGANPGFSPAQLLAWTQNANDLTPLSSIYVAAGGAQNPDMTGLRHALETMVTSGDPSFGEASADSHLNVHLKPVGRVTARRGEDLGFGTLQSHHAQMQLARDMLDDGAADPLGVEIARETGFKAAGQPASAGSTPDSPVLPSDAAYLPRTGVATSADGNLVGLRLPDGMQTFSSDDALLNAAGSAYDLTVAYVPATLEQEQALSEGAFALYDPNQTVFDAGGRKTTLGQVVASLKQGTGVNTPSALAPVTMGVLPGEWWNTRTPGPNQQGTTFTLLEGISAAGKLIDVGPADPTARQGYADWQSHTGFAKGFMMVQPHWVTNAQGEDLTDAAYFTCYKPYVSLGERLGSDVKTAGSMALGVVAMATSVVTTIAAPESLPLFFMALSYVTDGYLLGQATLGSISALQQLSQKGGVNSATNWLDLAANLSGGAANSLGLLERAGTMAARLGVGAGVVDNASGAFSLSRESVWFKGTGIAASTTNFGSMLMQGYHLSHGQHGVQDWLGFLTSAGLMVSGAGLQRIRMDKDLPARLALSDPPMDAEACETAAGNIAALYKFWAKVQTHAEGNGDAPNGAETGLAQQAFVSLPNEWRLDAPAGYVHSLEPGGFVKAPADQLKQLEMALLDIKDVHRALAGQLKPQDISAIQSALSGQRFNGSRPDNTFGIDETSVWPKPVVARRLHLIRRGDTPYWDLTEKQIGDAGGTLQRYDSMTGSPFESPDGGVRVRVHYADTQGQERMKNTFGEPTGFEPSFMTSSMRTLQLETQTGWQWMKFSLPSDIDGLLAGSTEHVIGSKTLEPEHVDAAVKVSAAASNFPDVVREPAGLSLDLGDGGRPITQLWRTMPVAQRGFRPGDLVAPLHVFTSKKFANSPLGKHYFGADATDSPAASAAAQLSWLKREVAPKLADTLWRMLTQLHMHPELHEQNVDVIVSANGHVLGVFVKDLSDVAFDPHAAQVWGSNTGGGGLSATALLNDPIKRGSLEEEFEQVGNFHQRYLPQVGQSFARPEDENTDPLLARPNPLLRTVANELAAKMHKQIPGEWLEQKVDQNSVYENLVNVADNEDIGIAWRLAAMRGLLLAYDDKKSGH